MGQVAQGKAYSDGACRGWFRRTKRAGWGPVVCASPTSSSWSMYGPCPDVYPCAVRAELWAIWALLRRAVPRLTIYTDNAEVVLGFASGALFACKATRIGADLWRNIWEVLSEMGAAAQGCLVEDFIAVKKVKAHLKQEDVISGRISQENLDGNAMADWLAKEGADWAQKVSPNADADRAYRLASKFYGWAVRRVAEWPGDTDGRDDSRKSKEECEKKTRRQAGPWSASLHSRWPHDLWGFRGGIVRCRRCSRSTEGLNDPKAFAREKCGGSLAGRAQVAAGGDAEEAFEKYNHTEEELARRGGCKGSGVEGPGGLASGAVMEKVRARWSELKRWRKEPPDEKLKGSVGCSGETSGGGEAGEPKMTPALLHSWKEPRPTSRKELLGGLKARLGSEGSAGSKGEQGQAVVVAEGGLRPLAIEGLQLRRQGKEWKGGGQLAVATEERRTRMARGRPERTECQIVSALSGLLAISKDKSAPTEEVGSGQEGRAMKRTRTEEGWAGAHSLSGARGKSVQGEHCGAVDAGGPMAGEELQRLLRGRNRKVFGRPAAAAAEVTKTSMKRGRSDTSASQVESALSGLINSGRSSEAPTNPEGGTRSSRAPKRARTEASASTACLEEASEEGEKRYGGGEKIVSPVLQRAAERASQGESGPGEVSDEIEPEPRSEMMMRNPVEVNELGHHLRRTGAVIWCARCGGHAEARVGKLLKQPCAAVAKNEGGARPTRLRRLEAGRHPVSAEVL